MVERITDPHRPVSLRHGIGRVPDGQGVKQPPRPPAPQASWYERARVLAVLVVTLVAVVIGELR